MKITKSQLKQILLNELNDSNSPLLVAINNLATKIDNLDISIDYLAGSITGQSPAALGYAQNALGRFARPVKKQPFNVPDRMNEIAEIIEQEIDSVLGEKKLTDAEYEKKKEIAAAIKRDDPDKPDSERYAIATAAAKKSTKKKQGNKQ